MAEHSGGKIDSPSCCSAMRSDQADDVDARGAASMHRDTRSQVRIDATTFAMGDAFDEGYASDGEIPVHDVELDAYFIDPTPVTNAQFAAFVRATDYVTEAEALGVSAVFHLAYRGDGASVIHQIEGTPWWLAVRGASWRAPDGPGSKASSRPNHPVVHVSWRDAHAYCAWAGKRLPSEAEWENAARGGLHRARFPWGDELTKGGRWRCNIWQGDFPATNELEDGFLTTAPVKSFRPNGFGLWQTSGNVWEWCSDWFDRGYYSVSPAVNPLGPSDGDQRVMRGGSYLCHDSYCHRYRVAARSSNTPDSFSANIGFRCANDAPKSTGVTDVPHRKA